MEAQINMDERETLRWRTSVEVSLAQIKDQIGRLVSDRESEKESQLRVEAHLRECDRESEARLQKQIDADRLIVIAAIEGERKQRGLEIADVYKDQRTLGAKVYTTTGILSGLVMLWEAFKPK